MNIGFSTYIKKSSSGVLNLKKLCTESKLSRYQLQRMWTQGKIEAIDNLILGCIVMSVVTKRVALTAKLLEQTPTDS